MYSDHDQWIAQAVQLGRVKRYDEARAYALRVIREDGCNPKALWIVASVTDSLTERRNALNALLRVQPDNLHARQMLNTVDQQAKLSTRSSTAIRSIKSASSHALLYAAVAAAALVIVAVVFIAATL